MNLKDRLQFRIFGVVGLLAFFLFSTVAVIVSLFQDPELILILILLVGNFLYFWNLGQIKCPNCSKMPFSYLFPIIFNNCRKCGYDLYDNHENYAENKTSS